MLIIKTKLPTKNLPIRRVIAKLFQSYIYSSLDDKEHDGYKHANGKVFKAMNFKIAYIENEIHMKYVALDKENEKKLAQNMLLNELKLGAIQLTQTNISIVERNSKIGSSMRVGGFVCANKKDDKNPKRKVYLEPKSSDFQRILLNNTLEKYEALFKKSYEGELKIKLIEQKAKEKVFHYNKGVMIAWYGVYQIEGDSDMLEMILDTGMGAKCMQGLGFLEVVNSKQKIDKEEKNEPSSQTI